MSEKLKKQWVKSVTAFVCVVCLCITTVVSSGKVSKAKIEAAKSASASGSSDTLGGIGNDTETGLISDGTSDTGTGENLADGSAATDADGSAGGTDSGSSSTTAADNQSSGGATTTKPSNGAPATKAEIITYCNTALNKVKSQKVGFTKKYVMKANGSTSGIPGFITKAINKKQTDKYNKGTDSTNIFPAAGYSWSSKLRESDVASATIKTSGQYYEITLKLGKENNPSKGEASSYGRVMSVIDAKDAQEMLPGIKSVNMTYHDGYVYAKIDSKTGQIVNAELSAAADVAANISLLGDVSITDIVSTETYSDFLW